MSAEKIAARKQLAIQTGVVSRLIKELASYKEDTVKENEKLALLQTDGISDRWAIQNQERVRDDASKMVPNTEMRLQSSIDRLRSLLATNDTELQATDEYVKAQQLIDTLPKEEQKTEELDNDNELADY